MCRAGTAGLKGDVADSTIGGGAAVGCATAATVRDAEADGGGHDASSFCTVVSCACSADRRATSASSAGPESDEAHECTLRMDERESDLPVDGRCCCAMCIGCGALDFSFGLCGATE